MSEMEIDMDDFLEQFTPAEPQPVRIEVGTAPAGVNEAFVASMTSLTMRLEEAEGRQAETVTILERLVEMVKSDREALVAAFMELSEAVRNQPPTVVHVDAPIIPEPNITVQPPDVHVTMEAPPTTQKRVTVQRDPLTGLISSADVVEG